MLPSRRVLTLAGLAIVQVVNALCLPSIPRAGTVHCCARRRRSQVLRTPWCTREQESNHPNVGGARSRALQILLPLGDDVSFKRCKH